MTPFVTPDGYPAVLATFGRINSYIRNDGTLSPRWEEEKIVRIDLPQALQYRVGSDDNNDPLFVKVRRITAHKLVAPIMARVLEDIAAAGLWPQIDPYGGGFVFRSVRGRPERLSLHSFGIAWDFRPEQNALGTAGTMHPGVVALFEKRGFVWGGRFKRPDPMHYQLARNC